MSCLVLSVLCYCCCCGGRWCYYPLIFIRWPTGACPHHTTPRRHPCRCLSAAPECPTQRPAHLTSPHPHPHPHHHPHHHHLLPSLLLLRRVLPLSLSQFFLQQPLPFGCCCPSLFCPFVLCCCPRPPCSSQRPSLSPVLPQRRNTATLFA